MSVWCYLPSYFRGELGAWPHELGWLIQCAVMTGCWLDFHCLFPVGVEILSLSLLLSGVKVDIFIVIGAWWSFLYWYRLGGFDVFRVCPHSYSLTLTQLQFWRRAVLSLSLCLWNNHHYRLTVCRVSVLKMLSAHFLSFSLTVSDWTVSAVNPFYLQKTKHAVSGLLPKE